jgi:hypothetical protein
MLLPEEAIYVAADVLLLHPFTPRVDLPGVAEPSSSNRVALPQFCRETASFH